MNLSIILTGICAVVPTDSGKKAYVLMPNARAHGSHGGGGYIPGHVPFIQWPKDDSRIHIEDTSLKSFQCLSDYFSAETYVLILAGADDLDGYVVDVAAAEGSLPAEPFSLDTLSMVDMAKIVPEPQIDPVLVADFDPDPARIAVRMRLETGSVSAPQTPHYRGESTFKPRALKPTYHGKFLQEIEWKRKGLNDSNSLGHPMVYGLRRSLLGKAEPKLVITITSDGNPVTLLMGNAPLEDILETGVGKKEIVDEHFALFYSLLDVPPADMPLPHLASAHDLQAHAGGSNCPPTVIPES
jgi:hypothetical protein